MPGTLASPYAADSIWYQEISPSAVMQPANFDGVTLPTIVDIYREDEILVYDVEGDMLPLNENGAGWSMAGRCDEGVYTGHDLRIPADFFIEDTYPNVPNNSAAVINDAETTVRQFQPFTRCSSADAWVTMFSGAEYLEDDYVTGDGVRGSHGGSGLSAFGGCLRLGDIVDYNDTAADWGHAIKVLLDVSCLSPTNDGFRSPAVRADGDMSGYAGTVQELRMGSLLALSSDFNVAGLNTPTGQQLANTLIKYGAYVVDSGTRGSNWVGICTEHSPYGDFVTNWEAFFEATWESNSGDAGWGDDVVAIFAEMMVVSAAEAPTTPPSTAATESLAGIELVPLEGSVISGAGEMVWRRHNPVGYSGTIMQYRCTKGMEHRLHLMLDEATKQALEAIVAVHEPVTLVLARPRLEDGVLVTIDEFSPVWDSASKGNTSHGSNELTGYFWHTWVNCVEVRVEEPV